MQPKDKTRSTSINKQTQFIASIYAEKDKAKLINQQFYCTQQKKEIKNLVLSQKMKQSDSCSNVQVSQSVSLQHVLKELARTSPKQAIIKHMKKTPSTSLHTPADFTKRNEQSLLKRKPDINNTQSPQTSYRSRLQLTKRNLWLDMICSKSQNIVQSDQRAATEYKTNVEMSANLMSDWKQPYFPIIQRELHYQEEQPQYGEKVDFNRWKDLINKQLEKRKLC